MEIYVERQKSIPWWLYLLVTPTMIILWREIYLQLSTNAPSEYDLFSDWVIWLLFILCGIIVPLLLLLSHQVTKVDKKRLYVTFIPFWKTSFLLEDVEKCYIKEFKPLVEYGCGIKPGWWDGLTAYTSYGNSKGMQFELKSGKKILVGSSKINTFNAVVKTHLNV